VLAQAAEKKYGTFVLTEPKPRFQNSLLDYDTMISLVL
jgi:hypothetical protein